MRYRNTLKMIFFGIQAKSVDHPTDGSSWVHRDLELEYIKIHLVLQHGTHLFPVSDWIRPALMCGSRSANIESLFRIQKMGFHSKNLPKRYGKSTKKPRWETNWWSSNMVWQSLSKDAALWLARKVEASWIAPRSRRCCFCSWRYVIVSLFYF